MAKAKQSFIEWMACVNSAVIDYCGMGTDDLPDWCYRDAYDDDSSPRAVAREAVRAARDY